MPILLRYCLPMFALGIVLFERDSAEAQTSSSTAIRFREHAIDLEATFSAGAAVDVNHDGHLDIVTGGAWYEAPSWKKHHVRDVEFIRGRFDDYACLPLDVNQDGWSDFLIANYRSQKLGWVEHPGATLGDWKEHAVERPGPMETGRLVDVDDDGRMDLLPNGRDFAAWWEIIPPNQPGNKPEFIRHDLPKELVGHGVGAGDINGDGRTDLIGPKGWLEAPFDRRLGRWLWHEEFDLDRDASVPILTLDVDRDGDIDLIWGRGHRTGVWWLEQVRVDNKRQWVPHAIDTSWSQPHTIELGDLDGDGQPELVAGKRYLGHDGKDPGEWNPLVIYWYRFVPDTRSWERNEISTMGSRAGFDLDPKLVDLDQDGDIDVLAPGRSGLFWLENLRLKPSQPSVVDEPHVPHYKNHRQVLTVQTDKGAEAPITNPEEWGRRREHILRNVERVMGTLPNPSQRVPLATEVVSQEDTEHYTRYKLRYRATPLDQVPAWLLVPKGLTKPAPAMLCLHQTVKEGKDSPVGLAGRATLHYAHELANRGMICIAPDYPSFGEYEFDFSGPNHRLPSGSMKAIWNNLRAIDLLESRTDVDRERIGIIGHSLGGHNAIFTAAFDLRIKAVVTSCGFTGFHDYYEGNLKGWTSDRYMPRIRDQFANDPDQVPFDFHELVASIAPRPFFTCSPLHDANFEVRGVREVIAAASEVYDLFGAKDALRAEYPDCQHEFIDHVRFQAYDWLDDVFGKK